MIITNNNRHIHTHKNKPLKEAIDQVSDRVNRLVQIERTETFRATKPNPNIVYVSMGTLEKMDPKKREECSKLIETWMRTCPEYQTTLLEGGLSSEFVESNIPKESNPLPSFQKVKKAFQSASDALIDRNGVKHLPDDYGPDHSTDFVFIKEYVTNLTIDQALENHSPKLEKLKSECEQSSNALEKCCADHARVIDSHILYSEISSEIDSNEGEAEEGSAEPATSESVLEKALHTMQSIETPIEYPNPAAHAKKEATAYYRTALGLFLAVSLLVKNPK